MSVFDHVSVEEYNFLRYHRFAPVEDLEGEWERVDIFGSGGHMAKTYPTKKRSRSHGRRKQRRTLSIRAGKG
jgi:hypothetical protein